MTHAFADAMTSMPRLIALAVLVLTASARAESPAPVCPNSVGWHVGPGADGTPPEARKLETWLRVWSPRERDRVLLTPQEIATLNERNMDTIGAWHDQLMEPQPGPSSVEGELLERLNEMGERVARGEYVEDQPGAFADVKRTMASSYPIDEIRAVHRVTDLRCIPMPSGLFRGKIDPLFDRNQCSRLHPGEIVRVLRRTPDDRWAYVRAGHGVGWLDPSALTPAMTADSIRDLRDRYRRLTVLDDWVPAWRADGELTMLRFGTGFPIVAEQSSDTGPGTWQILVPTETGWQDAFVAQGNAVHEGYLPLTKKNFIALLFARLGDPYGWGGTGSGRDCSGLLLDTAASFDLRLGRNSSIQGGSGWTRVDVSGRSDADKLAAIEAASQDGIVFLYMPGHIMVYLGLLDGRPYAISAISEYLMPCGPGESAGRRTVRLDRVEVTDLERGRGTERTAFIQRIAALSVFGY